MNEERKMWKKMKAKENLINLAKLLFPYVSF